ncbi:MAG: methionine--tRNA ligase subunit beta [Candidatus Omnitrophica bacterium]|nr:methionine--tRNA ligase subunit beta [Candidatus Omnitrophota bacterium]MCK5492064.1 methionine--tRNA ligase subunit beta [Candidatus Omnitrophota bacterium]MCK5493125.1 methionine--tRNA ligase subunit beta [Candidatus Omnitrophota bacterium]
MINFDDFLKLDLRVGKILEVKPHPDAEKLYLLKVDIGEKETQIVAGIKPFYTQEELIGKLITVIVNLEPKNIRGVLSEGMILAASGKDDVSLIILDKDVSTGSKIR